MAEPAANTAIIDPPSVLTPAQLQAARAAAASAPPFTPAQRDRLACIFGPTVSRLVLDRRRG